MVGKAHKSGHFQNVRLDLDLATILSQVPYFGNVTTLDIYMSLTYAKRSIVNAKPCNTKVDNCQIHHFFNLLCVSVCVCFCDSFLGGQVSLASYPLQALDHQGLQTTSVSLGQ